MAADQAPRTGLSLYANLLDPASSASGSKADAAGSSNQADGRSATATVDEAAKKQQALAASLRFQPTKRPQKQNATAAAAAAAAAKAKAKAIANKLSATTTTTADGTADPTSGAKANDALPKSLATAPKTTAADWAATASDDEWNYNSEKRPRGGRKNKKRKAREAQLVAQDWDDIYDPTRPNSYDEYKHSDEKVREVREWRELLYRHRRRRSQRRGSSGETSEASEPSARPRPANSMNRLFAPPANLNSNTITNKDSDENDQNDDNDHSADCVPLPPPPPPPPPPAAAAAAADILDGATGEDAYTRRLRMSQSQARSAAAAAPPPPPPPPPSSPPPPPGQISRAPVRYTLTTARPDDELESAIAASVTGGGDGAVADADTDADTDTDATATARSNLPGQTGFAERLMAKYGWSKGQGLGAKGTGITSALYAKVDKRKKKSDAEGGGFATPASMGRILGGQKSKEAEAEEDGPFGAMSEVVRLGGMLDGIDLDAEIRSADGGGIVQEIGEECSSKYGSVERVYIHRGEDDNSGNSHAVVFVHFVNALSALRAVNALDGRMFGGNTINARFWSKEKFLADEYE